MLSGLQPSDSGKYICDAIDDKLITIVDVQGKKRVILKQQFGYWFIYPYTIYKKRICTSNFSQSYRPSL